jgi:hypothetical protein
MGNVAAARRRTHLQLVKVDLIGALPAEEGLDASRGRVLGEEL